jgi:hypothetical protein
MLNSLLIAGAVLVAASAAQAAPIFSDTFTRSDSAIVNDGWTDNEGGSLHINITGNQVVFNGSETPDGFIAHMINTSGFNTILLDYAVGATSVETGDQLLVEWKLASSATWTNLATSS